jgi:cell wall-associated NlpC family hydrolase
MRRGGFLLLPVLLSACRMVGTPDPPGTQPLPRPATVEERARPIPEDQPPDTERLAGSVVDTALQAIGTPYRWGGTAANGFDCSGLIEFAYSRHGIDLPRRSSDQLRMGRPLGLAESGLRPADILGFAEEAGGASAHVGLYLGDGEFIHSSSSGVRISDLSNPYWQVRLMAARRILR